MAHRSIIFALISILVPLTSIAKPAAIDPANAARYHALLQQLRCLVCQNETLDVSQADLAQDLRRDISVRMNAGASNKQIIKFLTDRYGDYVLYRPPVKPKTYLLWFSPFALLAIGLPWLLYRLRRRANMDDSPLTEQEKTRLSELLKQTGKRDGT